LPPWLIFYFHLLLPLLLRLMMPHWFSPFGRVWGGLLSHTYVAFSALNFIGDDETAKLREYIISIFATACMKLLIDAESTGDTDILAQAAGICDLASKVNDVETPSICNTNYL